MRIRPISRIAIFTGILLGTASLSADTSGPTTQPTTAPTTTPAAKGTIEGQVTVTGALALTKPDLTRVVVYLASDPALDDAPHVLDHATVAQKHMAFVPSFTVVPLNTDIEFPNWDHFDHNVFSRSKAAPAFDLDRYPRGQAKSRVFIKVGVVQIFCNIHPSMRAIIYVTPNIYYTRCGPDGRFTIPGVPVGTYELDTWNERCGESQTPITVTEKTGPAVAVSLSEDRHDIVTNDLKPQRAGYGVATGLGIKRERLGLPVVKESHAAIDPEN